ncbi:MAG: XrtA/PEP-CTERM system exopolysaccharide export protein [Granulosicoccus sp.]
MDMRIVVAVFLLVAITASGCNSMRQPLSIEDRPPELEPSEVPVYRLGAGDVVRVSVWKNPELSVTVPVRPDGYISVPLAGDVLARGQTPDAVALDTESKLTRYIRTPKVSVIVQEMSSAEYQNRIRIVGGVQSPISMPHRDGMTVIDLVLAAGGLNEFASPNAAKLYRSVDGAAREFKVYIEDILSSGLLDTNYTLVPGDVLTVPERRF